jgi:serine/threonine protein kinase
VMVGPFGEVLVLDWGVAKILGDPAHESGTVLGTPGYMSPEQARGETARVDERADVYALGAVLRFLLAREGEGTPPALEAIGAKALAASPADRYASVGELAAEVERFLAARPVQAYPEGPVERARRLAVKYRTPLLLVAAYLLMRVLLALLVRI